MAESELVHMETSELLDRLVESRKELFNLRFQKATGQLDNTARLGHVRKEVARALTILRQREIAADEEALATASAGAGSVPVAAGAGPGDEEEEA
ncbi:MAG: 50S ribosomal protein L29 [Acidimicrobiales bacterium]